MSDAGTSPARSPGSLKQPGIPYAKGMRCPVPWLRPTLGFIAIVAVSTAGCDGCKQKLLHEIVKGASRAAKVDRGFHVVGDQVVFLDWSTGAGKIRQTVTEADGMTFRACNQPSKADALFAVDATHVFMAELYRVVVIADADPATFEVLTPDGRFSRDAKRVFFMGVALEAAEPASFRVVEPPFGRDERQAYVGTIPIPVQDIASWIPLERGWAEDPWNRGRDEKLPRPHEQLTSQGWSKDSMRVYWGHRPVQGADANAFGTCGQGYAKDGQHVYYCGDVVAGADPATFVSHDGPFIGAGPDAHDAQQQYKSGRACERRQTPAQMAPEADSQIDGTASAIKDSGSPE